MNNYSFINERQIKVEFDLHSIYIQIKKSIEFGRNEDLSFLD